MAKQIILKEDLTIKYDISTEDLNAYAQQIGINFETEPYLLWIAKEGLEAPVSPPWCPVDDGKGRVYYFNKETGLSTWDHPADAYYKKLVLLEKQRNTSKLSAHSSESELTSLDDMPPLPSVTKKVALDELKDFPTNEKSMEILKKLPQSKSTPPFSAINSLNSMASTVPKKSLSFSQRSVHFDLEEDDNSISEEIDFSYEISEKGSPDFGNFTTNPMAERIFLIDTNETTFKMPEYAFNFPSTDSLIIESENIMSPIKEKQETYSSEMKPKINENVGDFIKDSNLGTLSDLSFSSPKLPFSLKSKKNLVAEVKKKSIEENVISLEEELLKNEKYKKEQMKNSSQEGEEVVKKKAKLNEQEELLAKEREKMLVTLQKLKTNLEVEHEKEIEDLKVKLSEDHNRAMKLVEQNILENNRCEREKLEKNLKLKIELECDDLKTDFEKTLERNKLSLEEKHQEDVNKLEKEYEIKLERVQKESENKFQISLEQQQTNMASEYDENVTKLKETFQLRLKVIEEQIKSEYQTSLIKMEDKLESEQHYKISNLEKEYDSNRQQFQLNLNKKKEDFNNSEKLKNLNLELANLEESINNNRILLKQLEVNIENKETVLEDFERQVENKKTVLEDFDRQKEALQVLENKIDNKRDALEEFENKIYNKRDIIEDLESKVDNKKDALEDLESRISNKKNTLEDLGRKLDTKKNVINNLVKEIHTNQILLENLEIEINKTVSVKDEISHLESHLENLKLLIKSEDRQLKEFKLQKESLQDQLEALNSKIAMRQKYPDNSQTELIGNKKNTTTFETNQRVHQEGDTINTPSSYQHFCDSFNSNNMQISNRSSPKHVVASHQKKEEPVSQANNFDALLDKINRLEENLLTLETKVNTTPTNQCTDKNLNERDTKAEEFYRPTSAPSTTPPNNGVLNASFCLQLKEELDFYKQKLGVLQMKQASLMSQLGSAPSEWSSKTTVPIVPTKTIWSNLAASPLRNASSLPSLEFGIYESKTIGSLLNPHSQPSSLRSSFPHGVPFSLPTHSKHETPLNFPRTISSSIALSRERAFLERQEWQQKISSINSKLKEQYKFTHVTNNMQCS